jgi:hypothetical protein
VSVNLTKREAEMANVLLADHNIVEAAEILSVSKLRAQHIADNIRVKLCADSRNDMIVKLLQMGYPK